VSGPKRIQRRRTKGWRMPPNTVYVGRPTAWRNPFAIGSWWPLVPGHFVRDAAHAVELFRDDYVPWFTRHVDLEPLRGKDLACWCPLDGPCHADVLLELANR
jgi:hypothetical protein